MPMKASNQQQLWCPTAAHIPRLGALPVIQDMKLCLSLAAKCQGIAVATPLADMTEQGTTLAGYISGRTGDLAGPMSG